MNIRIDVDTETNLTRLNNLFVAAKATPSGALIIETCLAMAELLVEKNRKYGDSALNPTRILSKTDAVEQIRVRIDDKLNRIKNAQTDEDEDVEKDLTGYLILLLCARSRKPIKYADGSRVPDATQDEKSSLHPDNVMASTMTRAAGAARPSNIDVAPHDVSLVHPLAPSTPPIHWWISWKAGWLHHEVPGYGKIVQKSKTVFIVEDASDCTLFEVRYDKWVIVDELATLHGHEAQALAASKS